MSDRGRGGREESCEFRSVASICHIASLYYFLDNRDYRNLLTCIRKEVSVAFDKRTLVITFVMTTTDVSNDSPRMMQLQKQKKLKEKLTIYV